MNIMNKITIQTLLKNKTRTLVTIIGVILSAAMITAVTTLVTSVQNYVVEYTIAKNGPWHGVLLESDQKTYDSLKQDHNLKSVAYTKNLGFAYLEGSTNLYKPYLNLLELEPEAMKLFPLDLIEGRLPENEHELLISEHIATNGGVHLSVGSSITLELGDRITRDGGILPNTAPLLWMNVFDDKGENIIGTEVLEKIKTMENRTFTIVGISRRLPSSMEGFSAPGYTVITWGGDSSAQDSPLDIYIEAKKPKDIYDTLYRYISPNDIDSYSLNSSLLRYQGVGKDEYINKILYSLGGILIGLIMIGSISLIYNSFSISFSERKKLLGLLSSTGATARQRKNSVFFEAIIIASIGIPLGISFGILGIYITLFSMKEVFASILASDYTAALDLYVSLWSIVAAALISFITVLISAYIPARKSKKTSPLDAIRQSEDIQLTARKIRTSRFTKYFFGLPGELALKTLKRYRKRYRSTVFSLFISIVLFISATSFVSYIKLGASSAYSNQDYDIIYSGQPYDSDLSLRAAFDEIMNLKEIKRGSILHSAVGGVFLNKENLDQSFIKNESMSSYLEGDILYSGVDIHVLDNESYAQYLKELKLDPSQAESSFGPAAILFDLQRYYDSNDGKYRISPVLKSGALESIHFEWNVLQNEWFHPDTGNSSTTGGQITESPSMDISILTYADHPPFALRKHNRPVRLTLIISEDQREQYYQDLSDQWHSTNLLFESDSSRSLDAKIKGILKEHDLAEYNLFNYGDAVRQDKNMILLISVFSYGFIILISLITIANVFNTISTNVNLRRREFAILRSVGMTPESFHRMLNYECIFYGIRSLFYGIPISVLVTYFIHRGVNSGLETSFFMPVHGIAISVFSVFLVVFISMMYSMRKIKKENVLDALKNENH